MNAIEELQHEDYKQLISAVLEEEDFSKRKKIGTQPPTISPGRTWRHLPTTTLVFRLRKKKKRAWPPLKHPSPHGRTTRESGSVVPARAGESERNGSKPHTPNGSTWKNTTSSTGQTSASTSSTERPPRSKKRREEKTMQVL